MAKAKTDNSVDDLAKYVRNILAADERPMLVGPPGTAKTTTGYDELCEFCGGESFVFQQTVHEDMSAQEFWGAMMPSGGEMRFLYGPASRAWTANGGQGGGLLINEIDKGAGPVLTALYNICDDRKVARQTLWTGETIRPGPKFRVIATSNQPAEVLPDGVRDRFPIVIPFMTLTQGQIDSLPKKLQAVAVAIYTEKKYPQATFRKVQAFVRILKANPDMTNEEQQKIMEWLFGERATDIYTALVAQPEAKA